MLKPFVHQTVTSATIGMNQRRGARRRRGSPTIGWMMYCADPNWRSIIHYQIR